MKKLLLGITLTVVGLVLFAGQAYATGNVVHYGPIASTSPDSSTCGNYWATDTFDRVFTVDTVPNFDGTYTVKEEFKNGTFVTISGASPGACQTLPVPTGNGNTIGSGVTGKMQGSFDIVVTGNYDPKAECGPTTCNTTAGFVSTIFGGSTKYVSGATYFIFNYSTDTNGHWKNASANRGGNLGDITGF